VTSKESTTPDLIELTRRTIGAINVRDLDTALSVFAPDPLWDMSSMGMGTFQGLAAIRGLLEDWVAPYEEWEIECEQVLHIGKGVVLVQLRENGRPTGSTGHVQLRYAGVCVWADGMAVRVSTHADIDEARAAAERLVAERG
jgi:ketosteroid isomerase-like protein